MVAPNSDSVAGDADLAAGPPLVVVQVSKVAQTGGAARIALGLHQGLQRRGHRSWMATARGDDADPTILAIPSRTSRDRGPWERGLRRIARALGPRRTANAPTRVVQRALRTAASPQRFVAEMLGREWFDFPGTAAIPDLPPEPPDLIHCHNLHRSYFDLRQLAPMSHRVPVAMTLHDEWTFTGHCAGTLGCERWRTGCGSCPDLTIYPEIRRDGTHANWRAKQAIYAGSRLYISTPSQWLMDRARASMLAGGAAGWRTIPNGVDRSTFRPADRAAARARLGVPPDAYVLLFTANKALNSPFKDWETVSAAAERVAAAVSGTPVLCIALGDDGPARRFTNGELRFEPYRSEMAEVAAFYQAADLYLHAAKSENLATAILEALATGVPVVATAIGGIPEEVRSLAGAPGAWDGEGHAATDATGVLVAPGDAEAMGLAAAALLRDDELRATTGANAARDAALRFDLEHQLDETISWYREIIADWHDRERSALPQAR